MSEMSEKRPRQPMETRKKYILEQIIDLPRQVIADNMGVHIRTVDRDIDKMRESGEWHEWLELFLLRLYANDAVSDDAKLRSVTTLYARTITQKSQVETTGDFTFNLHAWRPEKDDPDADG